MSRLAIKAIRSVTATILIVGSIYVQHVARAQQAAAGQAGLTGSTGSELATHIENGKPFVTVLR
jgi:hypothetical protein